MTLADVFADPAKVALIVDALNNRAAVLKEVAARAAAELADGDNPALVISALADAGRLSSIVSTILSAPTPTAIAGTPPTPSTVNDPLTSPAGDEVLARLAERARAAAESANVRVIGNHLSPPPAPTGPFTLDPAAIAAALDEADIADDPAERARAAAVNQTIDDNHADTVRPLPSRLPPYRPVDPATLAGRLEPPDLDNGDGDDSLEALGQRLATTAWPPANLARHPDLPDLPARPAGDPDDVAEALDVLANLDPDTP